MVSPPDVISSLESDFRHTDDKVALAEVDADALSSDLDQEPTYGSGCTSIVETKIQARHPIIMRPLARRQGSLDSPGSHYRGHSRMETMSSRHLLRVPPREVG